MGEAAFLHLIQRRPFGTAGGAEWQGLARRLLGSLSRYLDLPLEFVGNRRHVGDNLAPLVRSVGAALPLYVRPAAMISCNPPDRQSGLRIDALLIVFIDGRRVKPSGLHFLTCDYLGTGGGPEWGGGGGARATSPSSGTRILTAGSSAVLPGCSLDAEPLS